MLPISPPEDLKAEVEEIVRLWDDPKSKGYTRSRLKMLGSAGIEELIRQLQDETKRRKRFVHYFGRIGLTTSVITMLVYLFSILVPNPLRIWLQGLFYLNNLFIFVAVYKWLPRGKVAKILAEQNDIRSVGVLLEAGVSDDNARKIVIKSLVRLLPELNASVAQLFTPEQKQALYKSLHGGNEALQLAILKSLEQIGDGGALPYVEKLAYPSKKANVSEKVQEAARACLPFLTEWAAEEQNRSTLLRASGEMTSAPAELLRPMNSAKPETEPETLLRATPDTRN